MKILGQSTKKPKLIRMNSGYTCEYCGDFHRTPPCDVCGMPPCRCLC